MEQEIAHGEPVTESMVCTSVELVPGVSGRKPGIEAYFCKPGMELEPFRSEEAWTTLEMDLDDYLNSGVDYLVGKVYMVTYTPTTSTSTYVENKVTSATPNA